jgi:hypothetical protein
VQVATLRKRGERLLKAPAWWQHVFFARSLIADFSVWKPLRMAIGVAGVLGSILKMVLLWRSEHAVVAAGLSGALVFVTRWLAEIRTRD